MLSPPTRLQDADIVLNPLETGESGSIRRRCHAAESASGKEIVVDTGHQTALQAKHAGIDARIKAENSRPLPDTALVATLKKQKLRLKEELIGVQIQ